MHVSKIHSSTCYYSGKVFFDEQNDIKDLVIDGHKVTFKREADTSDTDDINLLNIHEVFILTQRKKVIEEDNHLIHLGESYMKRKNGSIQLPDGCFDCIVKLEWHEMSDGMNVLFKARILKPFETIHVGFTKDGLVRLCVFQLEFYVLNVIEFRMEQMY